MGRFADVEMDVLTRCLDPVDCFGAEKESSFRCPDHEPLQPQFAFLSLIQLFQQGKHAPGGVGWSCGGELLACTVECGVQSGLIERLEQVVEGVDFEGADRIAIVSSHEHNSWRPIVLEFIEESESI